MKQPARSVGEATQRAKKSPFSAAPSIRFREFVHTESVGAVALLAATAAALTWSNSPWAASYTALWEETYLALDLSFLEVRENLRHWVNDGLMAIFFFVVGLEVKRELVHGELSSIKRAGFPLAAAIGGMAIPAAVYAAINWGGEGSAGWGIPIATDIAFALGVFALAGDRVSHQGRVFLLALAAVDDIGAILIIAIFYSSQISWLALGVALAGLAAIQGLRRAGLWQVKYYLFAGFIVWLAVLESGIHATLAGVALGLLTPSRPAYGLKRASREIAKHVETAQEAAEDGRDEEAEVALARIETIAIESEAPLERRERGAHPWSSFLVLPLFALANAGVEITSDGLREAVAGRIFYGVGAGLILGKAVGILGGAFLAVKLGLGEKPEQVSWKEIAGVAMVGGIGFTVSLFITDLALSEEQLVQQAKIGVLAASAIAGAAGFAWLRFAGEK